ncbi:MAG: hypothetical protein GQ574_22120 [Crocinitomix sp.]|nr:hypothetical protein [Crocinitomix sp.]
MIRILFFFLFFISYQCKADGLKGLGVVEEVLPIFLWILISILVLILAKILAWRKEVLIGQVLTYVGLLSLTICFIQIYIHYVFVEGYRFSTFTRFFYFGRFAKIKVFTLLIIIVLFRFIWKRISFDRKNWKAKNDLNKDQPA